MVLPLAIATLSILQLVDALSFSYQDNAKGTRALKFRQEMDNYLDLQYYGNMTVGGQSIHGILDTGSIELVVLSDKCEQFCGYGKPLYKSNQSQTYKTGGLSLVLSYGSGNLKAREAYESVAIGPLSTSLAPFWEVYDANMPLLFNSEFEAIVGLGPIPPDTLVMAPGFSKNGEAFAVLLKKLQIDRFSVCLGQEPGSPGFLTWNDDAADLYPGVFTEVKIPNTGYWMAEFENVRLGDTPIACTYQKCGAVMDSGTSLLALPYGAYNDLSDAIAGLESDCTNILDLPDLKFRLSGIEFSLSPDSYLGQVYGEASNMMANHFNLWGSRVNKSAESPTSKCQAALMHITMDSTLGQVWILGMPFFRKFYSLFVQGTLTEAPKIFTAPVDDQCLPVTKTGKLLKNSQRSARTNARHIDASKLRMPPWLRRASALGRVESFVNSGARQFVDEHTAHSPLMR